MNKRVALKPLKWEGKLKFKHLKKFDKMDNKGKINFRCLEESGICLRPYIPYAWQEKESTIILPIPRSKRLNILDLINRISQLKYEFYYRKFTSKYLIILLDTISKKNIKKNWCNWNDLSIFGTYN